MDADLGSALTAFKDYFSKYDKFVRLNPRLAAEVEAIIRWSSFLIATKKSPILGELLSSGANLLQLCNDIIIRQVIQSLELLAEIYARDTYGNVGKWAIITVIQIAKASIKLILLLVFNQGLTKTQSIVPLDRLHVSEIVKLQERYGSISSDGVEIEEIEPATSSKSVVLKSSGRRMRSIKEAPPKGTRFTDASNTTDISDPSNRLQNMRLKMLLERYKEHRSATLTERQIYGELLHITRPIAHLALMGAFGTKSWLSYVTSLAMDISSLYLVRSPVPLTAPSSGNSIPQCFQFNVNERMELGQRASSLLLYLLRSPFFDEYTKQRALEGLAHTAERIPIFGSFLATFVNYIPEWQKDYFRVWSE